MVLYFYGPKETFSEPTFKKKQTILGVAFKSPHLQTKRIYIYIKTWHIYYCVLPAAAHWLVSCQTTISIHVLTRFGCNPCLAIAVIKHVLRVFGLLSGCVVFTPHNCKKRQQNQAKIQQLVIESNQFPKTKRVTAGKTSRCLMALLFYFEHTPGIPVGIHLLMRTPFSFDKKRRPTLNQWNATSKKIAA